ncbi:MAG TPA: TetR/AcrR family transcriptional regulator [Anaerolineaceae bacterium]|nr:TetR/AcrR family transcriptional regulator [Anaerolineaceae bacterium]
MMARVLSPERKDKFMQAALKLFVEKGVPNTTTAEITSAAGSAAGTLFLYFPTKLDLVNELIVTVAAQQTQAINALVDPSSSAREMFSAIWNASIGWFRDHPDAYLYVLQVRDSGMVSPAVVEETNRAFAFYYNAIQKGFAEGSLKPYPLELIGGILYQQIVAVMNLVRTQPDPSLCDGYIRQGFEIFWNGIKSEEEK